MKNLIVRARMHVQQFVEVAEELETGSSAFDMKMKAKAIWDFILLEVTETVDEYKELSAEWYEKWEPKFQEIIDSKSKYRY